MKHWIVLGLVCALGMGMGVAAPAGAEPQPPKLKAKYRERQDEVRLNWRTKRLDRKAVNLIEIERGEEGAAFEPLDAVKHKPSHYEDEPGTGGTFYYRARVHSDDETSGWSNTVSVDVPGAVASDPDPGSNPGNGDPNLEAGQRECPSNTVDQVLAIVNDVRRDNNRGTLRLNAQLQWAARTRTIDQADKGKLSHDGWVNVVNQSGYRWGALAENIALGPTSPAGVMNAWMNSSGHRANILGGYRDIGIGCVIDRNGFYWWTQVFGA